MTYSYSSPLTYGPPNNINYYENPQNTKKKSAAPAVLTCSAIGGITGGIIVGKQNPNISKTGEVADSFAKAAYEKYLEKATASGKEAYNGGLEILKKLDSIGTPEELKATFSANKEAAVEICSELKQSPEEFLNNVTKENLNANKNVIRERINAGNQTRYQNMKNQIQACWDKESKKFIKKDHIKDDVYNSIKESCKSNWKKVAKYAGIGALAAGAIAFISSKIFTKKQ